MIPVLHISDAAITLFALALFHSLWQFMIIAIAWRVLLFLAKKAPALNRYYISLVALAAMPAVTIATFLRTTWQQGSDITAAVPALTPELQALTQAGMADLPGRFLEALTFYSPLIFWSYIAILIALTLKWLTEWFRLARLHKQDTRPLPLEINGLIKDIAQRAGLHKMVPVYRSAKVRVPLVTGFFKPVVLLPLAILSSLDVRQVETIILHEFRHIVLKDHLVNFLLNLVEIFFFYHPVTWWICREIRLEREIRIDEWIVNATGDPVIYARALINLEIDRKSSPGIVITAGGSKNHLFYRIKKIINMKSHGPKHLRYPGSLLILLVAGMSAAWFNPVFTSGESFESDREQTIRINEYPDAYNSPEGSTTHFAGSGGQSATRLADPGENDRKPAGSQEKLGEKPNPEMLLEEMRQLQEELRTMFGSVEFREQMRQAREESLKALEQMKEGFDSEEFRREMRQFQNELRERFDSEEFGEQMRHALEESRKAVEKMKEEFDSEEFRRQMRQFQNEMREQLNSEQFHEQMRQIREETRKALEQRRMDQEQRREEQNQRREEQDLRREEQNQRREEQDLRREEQNQRREEQEQRKRALEEA
jgi:bla regulator protein blaR1